MFTKNDLVRGADIQGFREILGLSFTDFMWISGAGTLTFPKNSTKWRLTGVESERPIVTPALSILIRYLYTYPDENFMPEMPEYFEIFDLIKKHSKNLSITVEKFGLLWGVSSWPGIQWSQGMTTPSNTIQRLFLIVKNAIQAEGAKGLQEYLDIVDQESQARGLGGLEGLMEEGTWKTQTIHEQIAAGNINEKFITNADLLDLRELLGLTFIDFLWLSGSGSIASQSGKTGEDSFDPIAKPPLCLMARYLLKYPDENFMPEMPEYYEIFDLIKKHSASTTYPTISVRRFGLIFGVACWSSYQWNKGKEPTSIVQRLFLIVKNAIQAEGAKGLQKYLDIIDQESRARGLGGLEKLFSKGAWDTSKFRKKINQL